MARTIWKGSITFGLVEIPVGLVAAERSKSVKLSYLDRRDLSPVGYQRYNKATGEEVPWDEIVRGYEYEKDEYVVISDEELQSANPELTQTVSIQSFVDAGEIEPIWFDKPYYLQPTKSKSKGYVLLRETLERTGKLGIAKVVIRTRESLAAVGVRGPALVLYLLRFADELRPAEELDNVGAGVKDVDVQPKEVKMAEQLVEGMTEKWDPGRYRDEYAHDLHELVGRKVKAGETYEVVVPEGAVEARPRGEVIDLMPLLKKSLEEKGARSRSARGTKAAKAAKTAKKSRKKSASRRSA